MPTAAAEFHNSHAQNDVFSINESIHHRTGVMETSEAWAWPRQLMDVLRRARARVTNASVHDRTETCTRVNLNTRKKKSRVYHSRVFLNSKSEKLASTFLMGLNLPQKLVPGASGPASLWWWGGA